MPVKRGEQIFKLVNAKNTLENLVNARQRAKLTVVAAAELVDMTVSQLSRIERGEQKFFGETVKGRLEKLFSALDGAGTPEFVNADWRVDSAKRSRRLARMQPQADTHEKAELFEAAPAPAAPSAEDRFELVSALLTANRQGALSAEQTKTLMAQVLK
jgi:transcriptional regulator with XRE-family HTH domain